jgi:23S rRNA pseudouridine1911/1915/1917 synthase
MEEKRSVVEASAAGMRLDVFLRETESGLSRTQIKELILAGAVSVNGAKPKPHQRLKDGDSLSWRLPAPAPSGLSPENIPLKIFFEDDDILVLDKPPGIVVHPGAGHETGTLVHALLFHTERLSSVSPQRPGIVHRLDKDTSGVMVVAKDNPAHLHLAKQFRKHAIERRYIAFVEGEVDFDEGVIDVPLKRHVLDRKKISVSFSQEAKQAFTHYRVLKRYGSFCALELRPQTGRTHQLRVHLAYLGHPILGDATYGKQKSFARLALHALELGFIHPRTGKMMRFISPLPKEMTDAAKGLKIDVGKN